MTNEFIDTILCDNIIKVKDNDDIYCKSSLIYRIKNKLPNIREYLKTRYPEHMVSYSEVLIRMNLYVEKRPRCLICGSYTTYRGYKHYVKYGSLYIEHCVACKYQDGKTKEKHRQTCLERYGVNHPMQSDACQQKSKKTCLDRYGVEYSWQSENNKEKSKKTCLQKYGVETYSSSKDHTNKMAQTCLQKYGTTNYWKTSQWKERFQQMKEDVIDKQYNTKKKNHTLTVSNVENTLYKMLCDKYGTEDIIRQHKSDQYPYMCDFYIKSLDCYIELQGSWTHGPHPYNSKNDKDLLKHWIEKSKTSKYFLNAIYTWTKRDVEKRECAKKNNLYYIEEFDAKNFETLRKMSIL